MKRRDFFQMTLLSVSALSLFSSVVTAEERRRGGGAAASTGPQLVDPKDPAAKAVNYVHNASEIKDKTLQTERGGVQFKNQHCQSCSFYQKDKEVSVSGKTAAPCQMPFATGKVVSSQGWCTTWAKKA